MEKVFTFNRDAIAANRSERKQKRAERRSARAKRREERRANQNPVLRGIGIAGSYLLTAGAGAAATYFAVKGRGKQMPVAPAANVETDPVEPIPVQTEVVPEMETVI